MLTHCDVRSSFQESNFVQRPSDIQHIYHCAKFECSSFSSLANTMGGPSVLQGTKKPGWNRVKGL